MLFGGLFGGAAALVLLWHMFRHLDIALDMDPAHASRHAQLASVHYRIRKCTRIMKNYLKNRYVLQIFCCFIL